MPLSAKSYTAANTGGAPGLGAHTGYTTVGANACESCHRSHSAPQAQRLLKAVNQRDVCFQCHGNAPVAAKNLATVFAKTYRHPLETSTATILHDAAEVRTSATNFSGARRHVDCADCHNSHGAAAGLHVPGTNQVTAGALAGASGVEPASYPAALPLTGVYPMTSAAQSGYTHQRRRPRASTRSASSATPPTPSARRRRPRRRADPAPTWRRRSTRTTAATTR